MLVQPTPATGEYTMWSATQVPHIARVTLSGTTGIPETKLRVVAPDVGGGFGSKLNVYAEEALCLVLARRLGLPVKWTEERSENYVATIHGRDVLQQIELAATEEGKITAVRVRLTAAMGAYMQLVSPGIPLLGAWLYAGCYDVQGYDFECVGVFTNTTPTDAYRGAGRPEATYAIERAVDALAQKIGKDPIEIRRLNFITEFPAAIASGLEIDSGNFHASLDKALELAGYDDLRKEQAERRKRGDAKQLGIGFSTYVEMCGLAPSRILGAIRYGAGGWDAATVRCLPTGTVQVLIGTSPHGQGHVTTFSQIVADRLGVPIENVEVLHGDTTIIPLGMDTYGSRSLAVGGVAVWHATEKIIGKARKIAAHELEVAEEDLEYAGGRFTVAGTDKSMSVTDAALSAWTAHNLPDGTEPGLEDTAVYDPPNFSWPAGCHIAVVEIDEETGGCRAPALRRGRRRRDGHQPDDRGRPGARGHRAGGRAGPLRGGRLRRGGEPRDGLHGQLPRPVGRRAPELRARADREPEPDEPDGSERRRRDRDDRLAGGRHERRRGRAFALRDHRHRDASQARARLAGNRGSERRRAMIPAKFDYERAGSVDEALELLGRDDAKLLAGGHSLLPLMKLRLAQPALLVDIGRIDELSYVSDAGEQLAIGALTRHHDLANDPLVQEHCPIISHTAGLIGDPQVRHRGTIGGSVAHGDPASDLPAVLLALDAEFVVRGPSGEATLPAADFFRGLWETAIGPQDVLMEIRIPKLGASRGWSYLKFNRRAQDWATVGVAVVLRRDNGKVEEAAVALTNMG